MFEEDEKRVEILYKVLLLGDWSVGKTCLLMRYMDNTFTEMHLSTIGIDSKIKIVNLKEGLDARIQIWDTAGQERYKTIAKSYIKGANGILLVYDVTKRNSFEGIKNWVKQIKDLVSSRVNVVLIGNKIDLEDKREVKTEEGEQLGKEFNYQFFETTAKDGVNINEAFEALIKSIAEKYSYKPVNHGYKLENEKVLNESKGCC
jgi:small GTP-binding protein